MYSNTMMVTLNSRIQISKRESGTTDYSTESNSEIRRRLPDSSHGDITVTQEQWITPPEAHKLHVSIDYLIFILTDIDIWDRVLEDYKPPSRIVMRYESGLAL